MRPPAGCFSQYPYTHKTRLVPPPNTMGVSPKKNYCRHSHSHAYVCMCARASVYLLLPLSYSRRPLVHRHSVYGTNPRSTPQARSVVVALPLNPVHPARATFVQLTLRSPRSSVGIRTRLPRRHDERERCRVMHHNAPQRTFTIVHSTQTKCQSETPKSSSKQQSIVSPFVSVHAAAGTVCCELLGGSNPRRYGCRD